MLLLLLPALAGALSPSLPCHRCAPAAARAGSVRCGPRVKIVSVGKTKETWLADAIELYTTRLRPVLEVECEWVKSDAALLAAVERCSEPALILDERGPQCTSVELGERLYSGLEEGGSRLSFFIGGAEGLPPELKADRRRLLSLSKLTFTHQMARLLLVEQIYRATEIRKGSGYHKD